MQEMINNAIKNLNKNSTLDEIKNALRWECEKVSFPIDEKDWDYMMTEILYKLTQ